MVEVKEQLDKLLGKDKRVLPPPPPPPPPDISWKLRFFSLNNIKIFQACVIRRRITFTYVGGR